ncbi:hypothetical protein LCI18_009534 [Fusarium solani-melongenae]|uniref:Uncharacterized protein n=1 Tax=Fusarium solani subsp. cucurbitae TaxID=2747967 RepID=A0ACD3ZBH6_FUSSC|nr:hypothetical protein LCI18_009534 [Fusarium solani-melongenae]
MAADKVDYVVWGRLRDFFTTEPPWFEHIYVVRIVDFTVGVPADEGGTCDDGISPRPDEEIRSAIFIQTSEDDILGGTLYETHRWPGSSKFRLSVTHYANMGRHTHLATDAPVGFIWKKDAKQHLPDIIGSIPTPDPSAIYAPGSVTSVLEALRTRGMLIEREPKDWYIDESGVFHERGRAEAGVGETI